MRGTGQIQHCQIKDCSGEAFHLPRSVGFAGLQAKITGDHASTAVVAWPQHPASGTHTQPPCLCALRYLFASFIHAKS